MTDTIYAESEVAARLTERQRLALVCLWYRRGDDLHGVFLVEFEHLVHEGLAINRRPAPEISMRGQFVVERGGLAMDEQAFDAALAVAMEDDMARKKKNAPADDKSTEAGAATGGGTQASDGEGDKPKRGGKGRGGTQQTIEGTEGPGRIDEIEKLAMDYETVRNKRMSWTKKEVEAQAALLAGMKRHNLTVYRCETEELEVKVVAVDEKAKVKRLGGDADDEE